jgi:hypothetical protein
MVVMVAVVIVKVLLVVEAITNETRLKEEVFEKDDLKTDSLIFR